VLNDLPFHYKQLFLSDQDPSKDFWVGRQHELAQAQSAIQRFRSGTSGALMVTGERFSGKSSLSHFIAFQFFERQSAFQIFPPGAGSCSPEVFHETMEAAFQARGNTEHLFLQIPSQSVIVFHNLELWWERHQQGDAIIKHIEWMIREFGHQCFFILNMNNLALKLLLNLSKIEEYFLDVVECSPMTPEELKKVVLLRHKATGLKLKLENQTEEAISELNFARLFSRFHDYSRGNVGVTLHAWISNIQKVRGDTLEVSYPSLPDLSLISRLPMDWMVVILQFLVHKILSQSKLMRLMGWNETQFNRFIDVLHRSGIVHECADNLWSLNSYMEPFLIDQLRARKVL
jgi:hypothetical protein